MSQSYDVRGSCVGGDIGMVSVTFVTPIVIFIAYFWNKLCEQNHFDMSTVQKFLIFNEKINILFLLATT